MRTPRSISGRSRPSPCLRLRSGRWPLGWTVSISVWHCEVARSSAALIRSLPSSTVIESLVTDICAPSAMKGAKASDNWIDCRLRSVISCSIGLSR